LGADGFRNFFIKSILPAALYSLLLCLDIGIPLGEQILELLLTDLPSTLLK
jgi:hypothetical protein